jgi:hypothetical protein
MRGLLLVESFVLRPSNQYILVYNLMAALLWRIVKQDKLADYMVLNCCMIDEL